MIAFEISGIRDILAAAERNCVKLTQFLLVRSKQGLGQARPNKIT